MSSDLISRQAAIDALDEIEAEVANGYGYQYAKWREYFVEMPPAQPEIIRCKDCKHWDTTWQNDYAPNYHYCPMIDGTRRNDFYCADAERREVTT